MHNVNNVNINNCYNVNCFVEHCRLFGFVSKLIFVKAKKEQTIFYSYYNLYLND